MAKSDEGRALTEAHKARQVQIASVSTATAVALWGRLDVNDIDASTPAWLASMTGLVDRQVSASQVTAAEYFEAYSGAETGRSADGVKVLPLLSTASVLYYAGPVRVKTLIRGGMSAVEAHAASLSRVAGAANRQTLMAGRLTVAASTAADTRTIGWRRVTDGNPCAFCAMLASRGAIYRDQITADGFDFHFMCGCTAEPEYSTWQPTEQEQVYLNAYQRALGDLSAAGKPHTAKNILAAMRLGDGFR